MTSRNGWDSFVTEGKTKVGVVLVHEIFGLNEYAKSVASELSKNGYWVAAVDLFRGSRPSSVEEGRKIRESMSRDSILDCLRNGRDLLARMMGKNASIGSMGFCMGGGLALLGACNLDFNFCIDFYGMIQNVEELSTLKGPVLLILAGEDERVDSWAYWSFLPAAIKYQRRVDVHFYPNVKHAFHRPSWPGHDAGTAKDAWSKTLQFLSIFVEG